MFALMRDGSIKPVQYHWIGAAIGLGARAAPLIGRGASYVGKGLGYLKPWQWGKAAKESGAQIIKSGKYAGQKFKDIYPHLFKKGNMPRFNITSTSLPNTALQSGLTVAGAAPYAYNYLKGDKANEGGGGLDSIMAPSPDPGHFEDEFGSMHTKTKFKEKEGKKDKKITDTITEDIKSGNMDEMIKDKITLFEKYLGKDTDKRKKGATYEAMVEFGLNLASARGGNTMDKIARSAKDPLKNFAAVGKEIINRAEKIKMAGIESGITAYEKEEDRVVDREAIAADVYVEQLKLQAPKTDPLTFVSEKFDSIVGNPDMVYALTDFAYETDKKGNRQRKEQYKDMSDAQIIQGVVDDMWQKGNAVELTAGKAGEELYESLPSGTLYLDVETGTYNTKP